MVEVITVFLVYLHFCISCSFILSFYYISEENNLFYPTTFIRLRYQIRLLVILLIACCIRATVVIF